MSVPRTREVFSQSVGDFSHSIRANTDAIRPLARLYLVVGTWISDVYHAAIVGPYVWVKRISVCNKSEKKRERERLRGELYVPSGHFAVHKGGLHTTLLSRLFSGGKNAKRCQFSSPSSLMVDLWRYVPDGDGSAMLHPTSRRVARRCESCIFDWKMRTLDQNDGRLFSYFILFYFFFSEKQKSWGQE